jgi:PEGA domain
VQDTTEEHNVPNLRGRFRITVEAGVNGCAAARGGFDFVNTRRMAALLAGFLLPAVLANASSKSTMRLKVLDSATRSVSLGGNGVPLDCDQVTFDAYCRSSKTAVVTNTLLVQEDDQPPFRIACSIESRFSRCVPLPVGETFDAKEDKHGITVYYDVNGKLRKQLYTLLASRAAGAPASAPKPVSPTAPAASAAAPVGNSSSSAPSNAPPVSSPSVLPRSTEQVACNFTSTPTGAEITLDGKYVGSTPSEIQVSAGTHVVVFTLPGFIEWKRDLAVMAGSQLTVNAILQKQ